MDRAAGDTCGLAGRLRHRTGAGAGAAGAERRRAGRDGSSCCRASLRATSGSASGAPASGFVIGGGIGFAFGLANGLSQLSNKLTDTTLQMVRNIPHLALIPLVILWFGIDECAKMFLVALGVFFPIYLNTLHGIRTVDPQLIEMGRIYGMTDGELFRRVIFPGALPSIFVGMRFALGIMWLTLIVAETIAASSGLGYMAMQAREFMQIDVVVLSILIYALLGKLADSASRAAGAADVVLASGLPETLESAHAGSPSFSRAGRRTRGARGFRRTGAAGAARSGSFAARAAADHPRLAQVVRRPRGAARHRPPYSCRPVRRDRRPQRLRQEHAAAPDRGP